jgi:hypothetical protein
VKETKLRLLFSFINTLLFISAFLGQGTGLLLADGALLPQPASYWSIDEISSPAGSMG